jgi:hypothetical protein
MSFMTASQRIASLDRHQRQDRVGPVGCAAREAAAGLGQTPAHFRLGFDPKGEDLHRGWALPGPTGSDTGGSASGTT